jgi:hypothetical protein
MRTLGFRTHVLLCCAAAATLLLALGRPWYGSAPESAASDRDLVGTFDRLVAGLGRWFGDPMGTTAWQALDVVAAVTAGVAVLAAVAALATLAPALQPVGASLLRPAALVAPLLVAYHVVDQPGPNAAVELRSGALLALGAAAVLLVCGQAVAETPSRAVRGGAHGGGFAQPR